MRELQKEYITVEQAKELCIKAHKGQWRKPILLNTHLDKIYGSQIEYMGHMNLKSMELSDGAICKEIEGNFFIYKPYSVHPIAVAETMSNDEEKIVAYLHDAFEDCEGYTLSRKGSKHYIETVDTLIPIKETTYLALGCITRFADENYDEYLQVISLNSLALKVKIADMFNNLSDNPSQKQKIKYNKGLKILLGAL